MRIRFHLQQALGPDELNMFCSCLAMPDRSKCLVNLRYMKVASGGQNENEFVVYSSGCSAELWPAANQPGQISCRASRSGVQVTCKGKDICSKDGPSQHACQGQLCLAFIQRSSILPCKHAPCFSIAVALHPAHLNVQGGPIRMSQCTFTWLR
jgi:hypothetical protein